MLARPWKNLSPKGSDDDFSNKLADDYSLFIFLRRIGWKPERCECCGIVVSIVMCDGNARIVELQSET